MAPARYQALVEQNRGANADDNRLQPGSLVLTPSVAELEKSYPDLCPKHGRRETMQNREMLVSTRQSYRGGRTYTVTEGDTLFTIARYELGKASRWAEIYDLNRDLLGKDFNYLTPGMTLMLPDGDKDGNKPDVLAPAGRWVSVIVASPPRAVGPRLFRELLASGYSGSC